MGLPQISGIIGGILAIIAGIIVLEGFNNGKIDLCASVNLLSGNYIKAKPGTLIFIKAKF